MQSLLLIFPVILASFAGSIPAEIKELRQQFNETLDKDDMVQNKLHQIEVKLAILNVELNRYKRSLRNSDNGNRIGYNTANSIECINGDTSSDYTSSVNIEDAVETKMVENIKILESEKAKLKARLCKLDKKKNKLKKKLKAKSLVVFKTSIALGAILWSIGYLGVIILFMISTESHDGGDLVLHKVYKSILGFTAGMFIQIFKPYYELDTK